MRSPSPRSRGGTSGEDAVLETADQSLYLPGPGLGPRHLERHCTAERPLGRGKPPQRALGVPLEERYRPAKDPGSAQEPVRLVRMEPSLLLSPVERARSYLDEL